MTEFRNLKRRTVLKTAVASGVGLSATGLGTQPALAESGDLLGKITLTGMGGSVGITFTGDHLIVPNGTEATDIFIHELPDEGDGETNHIATKTIPKPVDVIEWDPTRERIWATDNGDPIWLIDLGDLTEDETLDESAMERQFSVPADQRDGIVDGIAYDGEEDAVWYTYNGSKDVLKFDSDGNLEARITPSIDETGAEFDHISGVAVGSTKDNRETLYVGNNPESSNGDIVRVYADNGEHLLNFATDTGFRVEDLVCDPDSYDSEAILVRAAHQALVQAHEVPDGTCPLPGGKAGSSGGSLIPDQPRWIYFVLGALIGGGGVRYYDQKTADETSGMRGQPPRGNQPPGGGRPPNQGQYQGQQQTAPDQRGGNTGPSRGGSGGQPPGGDTPGSGGDAPRREQ